MEPAETVQRTANKHNLSIFQFRAAKKLYKRGKRMLKAVLGKTVFIIVVGLYISGPFLYGSQDVKIRVEDGVQVVYNPKKLSPLPGQPKSIILSQDLCIGDEEGTEDFIFSQIRSIQVDENGNIYVLDSKEVCVKVFDRNGTHLKTFGKKGQGPGELQNPVRMHFAPGNQLLIFDSGNIRISYFTLEGKCVKEIPAGKHLFSRTIPDSKGNIIVQTVAFGDTSAHEIKKLDQDLNTIFTLKAAETDRSPQTLNLISPSLMLRVLQNDNIVWGFSQKYEIFVVNSEGKTIRKIAKDYNPVKVTQEEKDRLIKERIGDRVLPPGFKINFPKYYPPYYFIICGDDGKLYVRTYEKDKQGSSTMFLIPTGDVSPDSACRTSIFSMSLRKIRCTPWSGKMKKGSRL